MSDAPFALDQIYVHLTPDDGGATPIPVTPDFWATIATRTDLHDGFLLTRARMTEDWPHWEMHPEGEEIVILLAGAIDLRSEEHTSELQSRENLVCRLLLEKKRVTSVQGDCAR